jgi:hypothetical protein
MALTSIAVSAILDSGAPIIYLPSALADEIASGMDATMHEGTPYVPCSHHKIHDSLEFGFVVPEDLKPASHILCRYIHNLGNVTAADGTPLCYFGVIGTNGAIFLLGDTFIRSAYLVYDVDTPADRYGTSKV